MEKSAYIQIKVMRGVLLCSIAILVLKFAAFFITRSNAILSDALESIINVLAGAFALYSLILAAKPKDAGHPYGHGKIEFISAGFEGGLILLAGIVIIGKSILNWINPIEVRSLDAGVILSGLAGLGNFILAQVLIRTGKNHNSLTLTADGKHLLTDTWSSIGLIIGVLIMQFTGWIWLDNLLAIVFGFLIMYTGYKLVRRSLAGLMDEADEHVLQEVIHVLQTHRSPSWIDIHNLRIQQYGSSFHIDCHVTLPWYQDLQTSHDELKNMENLITREFHKKVELFIHPDPCLPFSCGLCKMENCKERQHPFERTLEWNINNVMRNEKHKLGV